MLLAFGLACLSLIFDTAATQIAERWRTEPRHPLQTLVQDANAALPFTPTATQPDMRVRLLRNIARAASETDQATQAATALTEAVSLLPKIVDPKLQAEVFLEQARLARRTGDPLAVSAAADAITALGGTL